MITCVRTRCIHLHVLNCMQCNKRVKPCSIQIKPVHCCNLLVYIYSVHTCPPFVHLLLTFGAPSITVVWSKFCFHSSCSVHATYGKSTVPLYILPWINCTNEMCRLFLHHHIQKLGRFLAIFAVQPIHFVWEKFVFASTALYIFLSLKVCNHSVFLGKLCR